MARGVVAILYQGAPVDQQGERVSLRKALSHYESDKLADAKFVILFRLWAFPQLTVDVLIGILLYGSRDRSEPKPLTFSP